jgi:carboxyl-terminal processing protease
MLPFIKKRRFHTGLVLFLTGLFTGLSVSFVLTAQELPHRYIDQFHRVYQIISSQYVDKPSSKELFRGAIKGMIKSLGDPFTRYLDEVSLKQLQEMATGKFVGIGVEITVRDGDIVVITPIDGSPAMKAGVQAGDVIVRVNNINIHNKKMSDIIKLIKGVPGSSVTVHIKRQGLDELQAYEIERAPIKVKSVISDVITFHGTKVGYLRIKNFGSDTVKDAEDAVLKFNNQGIEKVVIDLRYNPGGLLTAAIGLSDLFLKKDQIIVSTRGRGGRNEQLFKAQKGEIFTGSMAVLVNQGSASASEIFASAMRDTRRGKIIGLKTFGKGSVQKSFNIDKDTGVAVTIAKYYTPSGECIHKKGIKPDIRVETVKLTKSESTNVVLFQKKKLLKKFYKKGMKYDDATRTLFRNFLKRNSIELSSRTSDFILKEQVNRYRKRKSYDLEFDTQLTKTLEYIAKK